MSLPAQTAQDDFDQTDTLQEAVSTSKPVPDASADVEDSAALESTIAIELNFKAFADQVPTTHHAKRVTSHFDPSIQDFADQALEIAAIRAELKRLTREHEALQQTLRQRDFRLESLREELRVTKTQLREATRRSSDAPSKASADIPEAARAREATSSPTENTLDLASSHDLDPAVESQLIAEKPVPVVSAVDGALNTTRDVADAAAVDRFEDTAKLAEITPRTAPTVSASNRAPLRQLIPVDHEGEPVLLDRDIITIGRTRNNDLCIPSRAVSRDHARLMIGRSVTIIDMGSGNGCFVNEEPVKKQRLRDGDILRIGDRSYRLSIDSNSLTAQ